MEGSLSLRCDPPRSARPRLVAAPWGQGDYPHVTRGKGQASGGKLVPGHTQREDFAYSRASSRGRGRCRSFLSTRHRDRMSVPPRMFMVPAAKENQFALLGSCDCQEFLLGAARHPQALPSDVLCPRTRWSVREPAGPPCGKWSWALGPRLGVSESPRPCSGEE